MDKDERARLEALESIAKQDPQYKELLRQMEEMERKYYGVLRTLSSEEQNAVCDFVSQCEEISWYMLGLACRYMRFL